MVDDTWGILNLSLTIVKLHQEDTRQCLICHGLKVHLEGDIYILVGANNPESLVLPVVDLTWLEISFAFKDLLHGHTNWRAHEITFETGIFAGDFSAGDISLLSNLFVLGSHSVGLFSAHLLFDLYNQTKILIKNRASDILTLSLLDVTSINGNSDLGVRMTLILGEDLPFVELVEHVLPTVLQYGLIAIAAEPKLNHVWIGRFSDDVVLAVVIIIEVR